MRLVKCVCLGIVLCFAQPGAAQMLFSDGFEDAATSRQQTVSFLNHATFGATADDIAEFDRLGMSGWINRQVALPATLHRPRLEAFGPEVGQGERLRVWWDVSLGASDQLRQRVAFALSEILVVSDANGDVGGQPVALAGYYDFLVRGAFGNYRQLLEEVTLSPVMGVYLSMFRSTRDEAAGTEPDENYAREIMQLFSIGLVELNLDGSVRTNGGQPIPTYDQSHIVALAAAFTGWNLAGAAGDDGDCKPWEWRYPSGDWLTPMEPCPVLDPLPDQPTDYHVTTAKTIVGGVTLPAGQTAEQDMQQALDTLFYHPNVGPFLARRLIQRLVTSNPTPAYIRRVATAFNNDGSGVRGNLEAVVRAILTDPEALGSGPAYAGKLREPLLRVTHLFRAYDAVENTGCYTDDNCWPGAVFNPEYFFGQGALRSPSVFNFFKPDYAQPGAITDAGLVSPEFQMATESQVLMLSNYFYDTLVSPHQAPPRFPWQMPYQIQINALLPLANNPSALLDRISNDLLGEPLPAPVRQLIVDRLAFIPDWFERKPWLANNYADQNTAVATRQITEAIYFVITSPQYLIER